MAGLFSVRLFLAPARLAFVAADDAEAGRAAGLETEEGGAAEEDEVVGLAAVVGGEAEGAARGRGSGLFDDVRVGVATFKGGVRAHEVAELVLSGLGVGLRLEDLPSVARNRAALARSVDEHQPPIGVNAQFILLAVDLVEE